MVSTAREIRLGESLVTVCDSMNTLYLLVEETESVSTSVEVLCLC